MLDYCDLYIQTLKEQGFEPVLIPNAFDTPYDSVLGWPVKLPQVKFNKRTILVMHFQDFVTIRQGQILELAKLEKHYGANADKILVTHWNRDLAKLYHGPINLIEFSNHNYALMNRLAQQTKTWLPQVSSTARSGWMCLNGRICHHRMRVRDVLQSWPNGCLSFGTEISLPEWNYATYRGTDNDENFQRLAALYGRHAVNIVTETEYDTTPGIITEKTLLAMLAGQIPVVIGYAGIVEHLRDLGLDVFDDLVDVTYDSLPNSVRAEQALEKNKHVILGPINFAQYWPRLQKQQQRVLIELPAWYQQNFCRQVTELAQRLLS